MAKLSDVIPDHKILLEMEVEQIGAIVLELWPQTRGGSGDMRSINSFVDPIYPANGTTTYPIAQRQNIEFVVAEAFCWLEQAGLVMLDPWQPAHWHIRTRRGRNLVNRVDVETYRKAATLSRELLHPKIVQKAYTAFQRGEYPVAVLQAFIAVEVTVRAAAELPDELVGTDLMRAAFNTKDGPLSDMNTIAAERESLSHLFAGAIGHAKNPYSHREKAISLTDAARLLLFASYLMDIIDFHRAIRVPGS